MSEISLVKLLDIIITDIDTHSKGPNGKEVEMVGIGTSISNDKNSKFGSCAEA